MDSYLTYFEFYLTCVFFNFVEGYQVTLISTPNYGLIFSHFKKPIFPTEQPLLTLWGKKLSNIPKQKGGKTWKLSFMFQEIHFLVTLPCFNNFYPQVMEELLNLPGDYWENFIKGSEIKYEPEMQKTPSTHSLGYFFSTPGKGGSR